MTDWADDNLDTDTLDEKLPEPTEIDKGDQRIKVSYKWRHNEQECVFVTFFSFSLIGKIRFFLI